MYVWAAKGGLRPSLYLLPQPNEEPQIIEGLPSNARSLQSIPDSEGSSMLYSLDQHGDERWQLYRFDSESGQSQQLTIGQYRHESPLLDRQGQQLAFLKNTQDKTRILCQLSLSQPDSVISILELEGNWILGDWSPDGQQILAAKYVSVNDMRPYIIEPQHKKKYAFASTSDNGISYGSALWDADGSHIYYSSDEGSEFRHLRIRHVQSGEDRLLSQQIPWNIGELSLSADGQWLAFIANEEALGTLYVMHTGAQTYQKITSIPFGHVSNIAFHPEKSLLAFTLGLPSGLSQIFTYEVNSKQLQSWAGSEHSEEEYLTQLIRFPSFDIDSASGKQRSISAFYHQPPQQFSLPYPVLISVHGGPESQAGLIKGPLTDLLYHQGMAVLVPNVRGSTGFGRSFTDLDNDSLREDAVKDIGALLDWIAEQPELDQNQVVIVGGSYGGFMVLASAVHYSERLLCGIDLYGMSNLVSFLENTESYRRDERRIEYGDERIPEIRQYLTSISPLHQMAHINMPLLVYQGSNDPRVPPSESRQMVDKLKKEGKEVWYLEASNEGHGLRNPLNQLFVRTACVEFVQKHLK